jgi:predicted helicase
MKTFHILDPFTEQELLLPPFSKRQSKKEDLRQYKPEMHANEIVLLAYYIAAVTSKTPFTMPP